MLFAFRIPERHQAITRFKLDKYTRARKTTARTCYLLRAMVANVLPETDWDWAKLKLNFRLYSQSHCHLATDKTGTGTGSIDWHIYFLCIGHKVGEGMRSVWFRFLHVFLCWNHKLSMFFQKPQGGSARRVYLKMHFLNNKTYRIGIAKWKRLYSLFFSNIYNYKNTKIFKTCKNKLKDHTIQ